MELATASTLEFRNAVRTAMFLTNAHSTGSWTDRQNLRIRRATKRYVGFDVYGDRVKVAQVAEKILESQGLTAQIRVKSRYIRGTCELV